MPSDRPDSDRVEHFLVDGVAPPVIGGGPPESPFEVLPEPEPEAYDQHRSRAAPPRRQEPPTSPIPVIHQLPPEPGQQKRKSWVARMFGGSSSR